MEVVITILIAVGTSTAFALLDTSAEREAHIAIAILISLIVIPSGFWSESAVKRNNWKSKPRYRLLTLLSGWIASIGIMSTIAFIFLMLFASSAETGGPIRPLVIRYGLASMLWWPAFLIERRGRRLGA